MTDHPRFKISHSSNDTAHRDHHGGRLVDLVLWIVDRLRPPPPTTTPAGADGPVAMHGADAARRSIRGPSEDRDCAVADAETRRQAATQIGGGALAFLFVVSLGLLALIARDRSSTAPRPAGVSPASEPREAVR